MFTFKAQCAAPSDHLPSSQPGSPWRWNLIAGVLPGLPCGALTVVSFDEHHPFASYSATMLDLTGSVLDQNRRITHVVVGGPDETEHALDDLSLAVNEESQGMIKTLVDRPRSNQTGRPLSTLDNVTAFLADAETEQEASLVVLDGFERARPYKAIGPGSQRNTARSRRANKQRTADLTAFARSRPHTPTVLMTHASASVSPEVKRSLGDAADVLVMHRIGVHGEWLSVNHKTSHGCWCRHSS